MSTTDHRKASILIVDDRAETLVALKAALEALGEGIMTVRSGEEALRALLQQDFAVILLDINMPGMDGFQTAELIRQRRSSARIPIIFITGYADDMRIAKGYSLGAVDYILAPVSPEVLRAKVAVFVDLHRKNLQILQQADSLELRAEQLHRLTRASLAIHSASTLERLLQVVTEHARMIVGARTAVTATLPDHRGFGGKAHVARDSGESFAASAPVTLAHVAARSDRPVRMARADLESEDAFRTLQGTEDAELPARSWLAAKLVDRNGGCMGVIELIDKLEEDAYTDDDEAIIVQLAQMTSIAIENTLFCEAREANRLKDEFLATLSHELRTPLNAIYMWVQLVRADAAPGSELSHGLDVIDRNVKTQTRLIEDLLDLSRIARGDLRLTLDCIRLDHVVHTATDALRPQAIENSIDLSLSMPKDACHVRGDAERLQQVVGNLLSNAIKHTPRGGRIEVSLSSKNSEAELRVADNGEGIDPAFLPHLFEKFRQADGTNSRRHSGLGIGLAIVRHIVDRHAGAVRAHSPGKGFGATFTVTLPTIAMPSSASPAIGRPGSGATPVCSGALSETHVLLVEDEADSRLLITEALRRCGATVTAAGSADEAVAALDRTRPHVIVTDIAMPDLDGYALIKRLRSRLPEHGGNIPALALTALCRPEDRARAMAGGFQGYVTKPVAITELVTAVTGVLASVPSGRKLLNRPDDVGAQQLPA